MNDETYNGWANRETWALTMWLDNDIGLYYLARDWTEEALDLHATDMDGDALAAFVGSHIIELAQLYIDDEAGENDDSAKMMAREVGSWWRVNETEVGNWALETAGV